MKGIFSLIAIGSIVIQSSGLYSQVSQSVGDTQILDHYIDQALANNLSLRTFNYSKAIQQSKVDQAKKMWQPNLDLNGSYLFAEGGRSILFPIGDLFNPAYGAINRLSGSEDFPTDLENFKTQLTPNNFLDASLSVSKPLINSAIKHNILIQQALVELSDVDKALQQNELIYQVKQAYYNHAKTIKGRAILTENIALLEEVLAFNHKLIKYDKATPDVISDVAYQIILLESQIQELAEQNTLTKILFNTMLNRTVGSDIEIDSTVFYDTPRLIYSFDVLVDQALKSRPEFEQLAIKDQLNTLNKNRINASKNPTLGVRGAVGIQAEEFSFDDSGPLYTLGFSLGWNLWDGGLRKKQLEELKIVSEQNALNIEITQQQITLQVANAYHNVRSLYARYVAEEAAIKSARTSYEAVDKRYKNDKALIIELLTAQNKVTTSKLNKVLLGIDILIAKADLERISFER